MPYEPVLQCKVKDQVKKKIQVRALISFFPSFAFYGCERAISVAAFAVQSFLYLRLQHFEPTLLATSCITIT